MPSNPGIVNGQVVHWCINRRQWAEFAMYLYPKAQIYTNPHNGYWWVEIASPDLGAYATRWIATWQPVDILQKWGRGFVVLPAITDWIEWWPIDQIPCRVTPK